MAVQKCASVKVDALNVLSMKFFVCCRSIIIGELGAMGAQQRRRGKALAL